MVEDSDKVITITREPNGYLKLLCDKNRLGPEGWSFMVRANPDLGRFQQVDSSSRRDHAF